MIPKSQAHPGARGRSVAFRPHSPAVGHRAHKLLLQALQAQRCSGRRYHEKHPNMPGGSWQVNRFSNHPRWQVGGLFQLFRYGSVTTVMEISNPPEELIDLRMQR